MKGTVNEIEELECLYDELNDYLAAHTNYPGWKKGVGKRLMEFIIRHSEEQHMKAIRLDVYEKNIPAISLYKKYGFQYIDTIDLGYSEYGLDKFELYQKLI